MRLPSLIVVALAAACGSSSGLPGDGNSFSATIDGKPSTFDAGGVTFAVTHGTAGAIHIHVEGGSGCNNPNVEDGCALIALDLDVMPGEAKANVPIALDGTTSYRGTPDSTLVTNSYAPSSPQTAIVDVAVTEGCDPCGTPTPDVQTITGTATFARISPSHVTATIHVDSNGPIPNASWLTTAHLDATVDLDVT
jgi:hypothetical protein